MPAAGQDLDIGEWVDEDDFAPRHNIAPHSRAPIIMNQASPSGSTGDVILRTAKWGLVPHWSKHEDKSLNTINARSENLIEGGGMWGSIKGKKRCIVICQGYDGNPLSNLTFRLPVSFTPNLNIPGTTNG